MKSFRQYLLEFDPNRGAPGRAIPLLGHYPTDQQYIEGKRKEEWADKIVNKKRARIAPVTNKDALDAYATGNYDKLRTQDIWNAYEVGKRGHRWQPWENYNTPEDIEAQMRAHAAGKRITLPPNSETTGKTHRERLQDKVFYSPRYPGMDTPAANLQTKIDQQRNQLANLHRAAADVHDQWMERNKNDPTVNPRLLVPYKDLPPEERLKDLDHLELIRSIVQDKDLQLDPSNPDHHAAIINHFGSRAHHDWWNTLPDSEKFEADGETLKPRMRKKFGVLVDVNRPWEKLDEPAQRENIFAGRAALDAYNTHIGNNSGLHRHDSI